MGERLIDEHIKIEYFKPDDLKPDEKEKMIIELAKENAKLRECVIKLTMKLYCKESEFPE